MARGWGSWVGATIDDRFRLVEEIGRGGVGIVYRAHDRIDARDVAIKVLHRGRGRESLFCARLEREAYAMRSLGAITAEVYRIGTDRRTPYVAMELLDGLDLESYLLDRSLDVAQTTELGRLIAEALRIAHDAGFVHRDLKPGNVFLERTDGAVRIRLLDFGIVKLVRRMSEDDTLTDAGSLMGTLPYMAPEQIYDASNVDHRADIWSFGVTLHHALTGELPFDDRRLAALARKIVKIDPPPPSSLRPEVGSGLDALVAACLDKDPKRRPATVGELLAALEDLPRSPIPTPTVRNRHPSLVYGDTQGQSVWPREV